MYARIAMMAMAVVAMATLAIAADEATGADAILGDWKTEGGKSIVTITKNDGKYNGTIVWLSEPLYPAGDAEAGKEKHDRNNPDEAQKAKPIKGLKVLQGFSYEDGEWSGGTIYDPENGKTYKCVMKLEGDVLNVRGYVGIQALGRTTQWTRTTEKPADAIKVE